MRWVRDEAEQIQIALHPAPVEPRTGQRTERPAAGIAYEPLHPIGGESLLPVPVRTAVRTGLRNERVDQRNLRRTLQRRVFAFIFDSCAFLYERLHRSRIMDAGPWRDPPGFRLRSVFLHGR